MRSLKSFYRNARGATSIEYALIAALIAIVIIVGARAVGTWLNVTFDAVSEQVDNSTN